MTTTLDLVPFLAKAAEFPEEVGPRLVLADFLEEQGDPWAEFIRVQCELAEVDPNWLGTLPCCMGMESRCTRCLRSMRKLEAIRQRSRDLLDRHGGEWARRVFAGVNWVSGPLTEFAWVKVQANQVIGVGNVHGDREIASWDWHLGLPSIFRVPTLAAWMGEACYCTTDSQFRASGMCKKCHGTGRVGGIAAALRGRVPVREVWCGDREPLKNRFREGDYFWSKGTSTLPSSLPNDVWDLLENYLSHYPVVALTSYPTPDAARLALARAMGRWTTHGHLTSHANRPIQVIREGTV